MFYGANNASMQTSAGKGVLTYEASRMFLSCVLEKLLSFYRNELQCRVLTSASRRLVRRYYS